MRSNNQRYRTALFCLFFAALQSWAVAESEHSPWRALPEETVVALRIPDGKALVETLQGTKLGTVMLSEQRKAAVVKVLESDDSGEWDSFQKQLLEYGLTPEDLLGLLAGETGYAFVLSSEAEGETSATGLGWVEPGGELAGKTYEALGKVLDEQDDENSVLRVDLTIADQPVMQLLFPETKIEYTEEWNFDHNDEEEDDAFEKAYKKHQDSAIETLAYRPALVCVVGDRLLIAYRYEAQNEEAATASAEQLGTVLAQWIETQASNSGSFVSRLSEEAGVARVMALEGLPVFELLGDAAPLLKMLRESDTVGKQAEPIIKMLGAEGLGPFSMRSTLRSSLLQTHASIALPAPRQGLMRLFDQEPLEVDPPQWVPRSTVRYTQWGFDFGKAYEIIKEEVTLAFPEQAASSFAMAEIQVQNFAKASLAEILNSLGNRQTYLSFGTESGDASSNEEAVKASSPGERVALVLQIEDEELWAGLLKAISPLASMTPGVEFSEEQGFSGWRMKNEVSEGGLFLGKGYLTLGIGSGVVETMLSSLSNPPTGSDALRGSELFEKAGDLMDLKPALVAEITDGDRYMVMLRDWVRQQMSNYEKMLNYMEEDSDDDEENLFFALAKAAMPTEAEVKGMTGVIASRVEVNEDGIFSAGVQEVPAP